MATLDSCIYCVRNRINNRALINPPVATPLLDSNEPPLLERVIMDIGISHVFDSVSFLNHCGGFRGNPIEINLFLIVPTSDSEPIESGETIVLFLVRFAQRQCERIVVTRWIDTRSSLCCRRYKSKRDIPPRPKRFSGTGAPY